MEQVDKVILNRLSVEIGQLKVSLTQAQVYNEILINENKRLNEELDKFAPKEEEIGEAPVEEGE